MEVDPGLESHFPVPIRDFLHSPGDRLSGDGVPDGDSKEAERAVRSMVDIFVQKEREKMVGGW